MYKWKAKEYAKLCVNCDAEFTTTSRNHKHVTLCPLCRKEYKRKYNTSYIKNKRYLTKINKCAKI